MRTTAFRSLLFGLLCLAWPLAVRAEIVVVVHPDNPVTALTSKEVSDLYLGRTRSLARTGHEPMPVAIFEHPVDSPLRESFFRTLNGMNLSQLNAYWARLRFSGEVLPPVSLADSRAVVATVSRNRNAIGYAEASQVGGTVKIVLRLKE